MVLFSGSNDAVICFQCGLRSNSWLPIDNPWIEHSYFRPNCPFLQLSKGKEFIKWAFIQVFRNLMMSNFAYSYSSFAKYFLIFSQRSNRDDKETCATPHFPSEKAIGERQQTEDNDDDDDDDLSLMPKHCKICLTREIQLIFLPCGHLVSCMECSSAISKCPFCRAKIKGSARAFFTQN